MRGVKTKNTLYDSDDSDYYKSVMKMMVLRILMIWKEM